MKIVFFNRFFFPDTSATSQILSDLAFDLAERGAQVEVVTSRRSRSDARLRTVRGIVVHSVSLSRPGPQGLPTRALEYMSYYVGAVIAAYKLLRQDDIAVIMTDPPMLSLPIAPVAKKRGSRAILWLQDLFPEVAREYGIRGMRGQLGSVMQRLRNASIGMSDAVVVIAEQMAKRLNAQHVSRTPELIHNWPHESIAPTDATTLRSDWGLEGQFIVAYSGNLGRVHEFDTMFEAAKLLHDEPKISFLVVGHGARLRDLQDRVRAQGLRNVTFQPHQPRELISQTLAVADIHLCVLRPEFEGLVQPSKLYGILASGRPTLFIGATNGETAEILRVGQCGMSIRTGDAPGLVRAILELRDDPTQRLSMGVRARQTFEQSFSTQRALAAWRQLLSHYCSDSWLTRP